MSKYFKPRSLTWWGAMVPLICGLIVATEPMHGQAALVQSISNATGDAPPMLLINAGLVGIGFRGALK